MSGTFLYVGRIEGNKGVFDLLDAFASVRQSQSAQLVFVGSGSALHELQSRVAERGYTAADVRILGNVPHREIFALMRQALAVVTPTQTHFPEGRCMSAMEAFFSGTPVIAPDFGPFPYLVHHQKNGLLYTPNSTTGLATAMRMLLMDSALLATLRDGALATGFSLAEPQRTFLQAVQAAVCVEKSAAT
jgi:glycosyltransferase involved in cell wall biosynthesis